jgi:hypothetical protein
MSRSDVPDAGMWRSGSPRGEPGSWTGVLNARDLACRDAGHPDTGVLYGCDSHDWHSHTGHCPDCSARLLVSRTLPVAGVVAGSVVFFPADYHGWWPEPLEFYRGRHAAAWGGALRCFWQHATTARLAASMGQVSQWVLASAAALAFVFWTAGPLETAAVSLGGSWCVFVLYAILRRGK